MTPKMSSFIQPNYIEQEDNNTNSRYIVVRVQHDGQIFDGQDAIDVFDVNFTMELSIALELLPSMQDFIGCVNCMFPVAFKDEICNVIYTPHHPYIPAAYVVTIFNTVILSNTVLINFSDIHWQSHVKCCNCRISLTVTSLNIYNVQVDEYTNEQPCIILDASCVSFFCKQRIE